MSAPSVDRYFNATSALVADFLRNLKSDDPAGCCTGCAVWLAWMVTPF